METYTETPETERELFESKNHRIYPKIKPHFPKICSECNKPFMGYKLSKICPECKKKESNRPKRRLCNCSRCGRMSHSLIFYDKTPEKQEWLCSFCMSKVRNEAYFLRNYGAPKPITKVCPVCLKTFETKIKVIVYCSIDCKSQRQNEKVREYYKIHPKHSKPVYTTPKVKICPECKNSFTSKANNQKFCKVECRALHNSVIL